MQEIIEEYGEFIIEAVSGVLLLGILVYFFLGSPSICVDDERVSTFRFV